MRTVLLSWYLVGLVAVACVTPVLAEEADGCSHFRWDVTHELAVMKQAPRPLTAASKPGAAAPRLEVDKLYEVKLTPQSAVTYAVPPAKPTLDDSARGGLVRFHTGQPGLYRVSITSGHWIDVVEGAQAVKSKDFQGSHGCERPHKIVLFELPGEQDLVLQLSGATASPVLIAITPVPITSKH